LADEQNDQTQADAVTEKVSAETRAAWLEAMGVDLWVRRDMPAQGERNEPVAVESPAENTHPQEAEPDIAQAPVGDVPVDRAELPVLARMVSECTRCSLSKGRTKTVFGTGSLDADWMFVGEAPGREEDRRGEPFVGRAGQLLDSILFAIGLERDDVYIANVLKCRPPDNRDPMGEEVVQCEPYLHRQIELVQPRIIIAMGRFAAQSLLRSTEAIGRLRGQEHSWRESGIPLVVTYHPAYLLRSPEQKAKVWDDLVVARSILDRS